MVQLCNFFFRETDTLNNYGIDAAIFSHLIHKSICITKLLVKKDNWKCNTQNNIEYPSSQR